MFPLSHLYTAEKVLGRKSKMLAIGCFWPDLAPLQGIDRRLSHCLSREFLCFCRERHPQRLELAYGVLSHGNALPGADYYSDECWLEGGKGFCFQRIEKYAPLVQEACGLPRQLALWKGHNFVEMAFELYLGQLAPDLGLCLRDACLDPELCLAAAEVLGDYFCLSGKSVAADIALAPELFAFTDVDAEKLALRFGVQLKRGLNPQQMSLAKIGELLRYIYEEENHCFPGFFERIVPQIRADLQKLMETC